MSNFNKLFLMGNLTRNPELRWTPSGVALCTLSIAVNKQYKDKRSGEMVKSVDYFNIDVWGPQAENCEKYLEKGRPVFIEGRLQLDRWEDRNTGENRSRIKVIGERVVFLGSRDNREQHPHPAGGGFQEGRNYSGADNGVQDEPEQGDLSHYNEAFGEGDDGEVESPFSEDDAGDEFADL